MNQELENKLAFYSKQRTAVAGVTLVLMVVFILLWAIWYCQFTGGLCAGLVVSKLLSYLDIRAGERSKALLAKVQDEIGKVIV